MIEDARYALCTKCPSNGHSVLDRNEQIGDTALVVDWPSEIEEKRNTWLAGKRNGANDLLRALLEAQGVNIDDLYICSAVNCRPNAKKKAMQKNAMLACRERLIQELKDAGIKKVLCVGALGYSALMSSPKLDAVTKIRGRWRDAYGMKIMATLPPGFVFGTPDYFRDLAFDINKFFTTDGREPFPDVDLWIPETVKEADEAFEWLNEQRTVSLDLETTGFSPISNDVLAAGFGVLHDDKRSATVVILDDGILSKTTPWRRIAQLLASPVEIVMHNGKFDLQFLKEQFTRRKIKYNPVAIHDTMLLHYTLDERPIGKFKSHGLEAIARTRLDAPDYGIDVKKFLEEWETADEYDRRDMRKKLHIYLGLDCYYTARLFPDLWNEAHEEDPKLLDLYENLLIPGSLAIAEIEHHGILIDQEFYEKSRDVLEKKAATLLKKIQRKTKRSDFNPGSPKQVKEYIYEDLELPFGLTQDKDGKVYHTARRGGLQEGATAAPVLKSLAYRYPEHKQIIDDICEYRNLSKNIGTYVNGILQRCDTDGRIRTSLNLAGTATGRLSSSNPNLQNVPDASHTGVEIRGGFIPTPGNVFIEADHKQLEVRVAAWLSGDEVMRGIFESGRDPHQEIAYSIYGLPKEQITHYMRWLAKNILFGLLYGRGYESVATGPEQEDIAARGGRRWGLAEVKSFYDNLLAEWAQFAEWQQNQKVMGYRDGEIVMPTGRRRRFGFIPRHDAGYVGRASFNNPIQGTASDFTLYALIQIHAQLPEGAHLVLTVHDSLLIDCPEHLVEEVCALIHEVMEEDTLFDIDVPLLADIDIEKRWGEKEGAKQHIPIVEQEAIERAENEAKLTTLVTAEPYPS